MPDERVREAIRAHRGAIVEHTVEAVFSRHPELALRYGEAGREHCRRDTAFHLDSLAEAAAAGAPALFADYVAWARATLAARGIPAADLAENLEAVGAALAEHLPPDLAGNLGEILGATLRELPRYDQETRTGIGAEERHGELARRYLDALLAADQRAAAAMILAAADGGVPVRELYLHVFQRTQHEIGRLWQANRISVAQEHYCTAATQLVMAQLYPRIFSGTRKGRSLVIACVAGDLHEIGARMVADFFEMAGWDSHYCGASTPARGVVEFVLERAPDIVGISVTLASHLGAVTEVIGLLRKADGARRLKLMTGGAPFNAAPDLWRQVGADGTAADADAAIALAESWVTA